MYICHIYICIYVYIQTMHVTRTRTPAAQCSATATGLTAAHNASLLWGTYRPHLFNGTEFSGSIVE